MSGVLVRGCEARDRERLHEREGDLRLQFGRGFDVFLGSLLLRRVTFMLAVAL